MSITPITSLKEWEAMLAGPLPLAVLFMDSDAGEVPHADVLDKSLTHFAQHHREKARYLTLDIAKLPDAAEAAGVSSAPRLQVLKHGRPAGGALLPEYKSVEEMEAVLLRHILKSKPA